VQRRYLMTIYVYITNEALLIKAGLAVAAAVHATHKKIEAVKISLGEPHRDSVLVGRHEVHFTVQSVAASALLISFESVIAHQQGR
jgi:hypothetical protein